MKKAFLISIVVLCSCAQTPTKQQKAEQLIKSFLDTTLNDNTSYQPMKFSALDTFNFFLDTPAYRRAIIHKRDSLMNDFFRIGSNGKVVSENEVKRFKFDHELINKLNAEDSAFVKHYKPKRYNWRITHIFRSKNPYGALMIDTVEFALDSDLVKVLYPKKL